MKVVLYDNVVRELFNSLIDDLGPDIVGLHLMNLARLRITGAIGDDACNMINEALRDLIRDARIEMTSLGDHPYR